MGDSSNVLYGSYNPVVMGVVGVTQLSGLGPNIAATDAEVGALKTQATIQRDFADYNADLAEARADDAIERGKKEESAFRKKVQQAIGSQRAALAAAGVELDEGSALDIQSETAALGEIDALNIRNNASREAFGFKSQAIQAKQQGIINYNMLRTQARIAEITGRHRSTQSVLSYGGQVAKFAGGGA